MDTLACLKKFNKIYKEMDIIHHNYAKKCGLSDMAYWILYSMAESDECFTQRDFCRTWFSAPQTVNSALKDLERRDIIRLEAVPGNKKNKWIKLTENGAEFMEKTIVPLMKAECMCFAALSNEECDMMLTSIQRYKDAFKENVDDLKTEI